MASSGNVMKLESFWGRQKGWNIRGILVACMVTLTAVLGNLAKAEVARFPEVVQLDENSKLVFSYITSFPSPNGRWQIVTYGVYYYERDENKRWTANSLESIYSGVYPGSVTPTGAALSGKVTVLKSLVPDMGPVRGFWSNDSKYCVFDTCYKPYTSGEIKIFSTDDWTAVPFVQENIFGDDVEAMSDGLLKVLAYRNMAARMGDEKDPDLAAWIVLDPVQLVGCGGHYLPPNWSTGTMPSK
jgi:hypothetical protein